MHIDTIPFLIVVAAIALVTCTGFAAARWRPAEDPMRLSEWGLGGRGFVLNLAISAISAVRARACAGVPRPGHRGRRTVPRKSLPPPRQDGPGRFPVNVGR
jgi:hypothetical protein